MIWEENNEIISIFPTATIMHEIPPLLMYSFDYCKFFHNHGIQYWYQHTEKDPAKMEHTIAKCQQRVGQYLKTK